MAQNKSPDFDKDENQLADLAKALAHPARIAILKILAERKTCICGEIVDVLPLAQSTVSQHLKELKEIGLVKGEIEGPRSCYCLDPDTLSALFGTMKSFLDEMTKAVSPTKCC
jgi:DNA-binding transcriptional ArsR family regulator